MSLFSAFLPLPLGEGRGEGLRPIDSHHPLTRRCAPPSPHGRGLLAISLAGAVLLLPFTNTVLIPGLLLLAVRDQWFAGGSLTLAFAVPGLLLIAAGLALVARSISLFVRIGRGTLAPWDPTRVLITTDVYRLSRNPMKSGLFLVLLGESEARAEDVRNAGAIFVGPSAPVAAGDYATGGNHVLPTGGWARSVGGLGLETFLKPITIQRITPGGLELLRPTVEALAAAEGMTAHAEAVRR